MKSLETLTAEERRTEMARLEAEARRDVGGGSKGSPALRRAIATVRRSLPRQSSLRQMVKTAGAVIRPTAMARLQQRRDIDRRQTMSSGTEGKRVEVEPTKPVADDTVKQPSPPAAKLSEQDRQLLMQRATDVDHVRRERHAAINSGVHPDTNEPIDVAAERKRAVRVSMKEDAAAIQEHAIAGYPDVQSPEPEPSKQSVAMDVIQSGIDAVGVVDPTPVSDGINAAISVRRAFSDPARRKEHVRNALISSVSMIPYIGDTAKLLKVKKYAKTAERAGKLTRETKAAGALADAQRSTNAAKSASRDGFRSKAELLLDSVLGRSRRQPSDESTQPRQSAGGAQGSQQQPEQQRAWQVNSIRDFLSLAKTGKPMPLGKGESPNLAGMLKGGATDADAAATFAQHHKAETKDGGTDFVSLAEAMQSMKSQADQHSGPLPNNAAKQASGGNGGGSIPPTRPFLASTGSGDDARDPRKIEDEVAARDELAEANSKLTQKVVKTTLSIGALGGAVVGAVKGLQAAAGRNKALLERQEYLRNFNGDIGLAFAQRDLREIQRNLRKGRLMADAVGDAAEADSNWEDFKSKFATPVDSTKTKIGAAASDGLTSTGEFADDVSGASAKLQGLSSVINQTTDQLVGLSSGAEALGRILLGMDPAKENTVANDTGWASTLDDISDGRFDGKSDSGDFFKSLNNGKDRP